MNSKILFALMLAGSVACQSAFKPMPTELLTPENMPTVPQELLQPIEISARKSATGEAELKAYVSQVEKAREAMRLVAQEQQVQVDKLNSVSSLEEKQVFRSSIIADRKKIWDTTQREINNLRTLASNTQDKEVKIIIEHSAQKLSIDIEIWQKLINLVVNESLMSATEKRKLNEAMYVYYERMESAIKVSQAASRKLAEKYQVYLPVECCYL